MADGQGQGRSEMCFAVEKARRKKDLAAFCQYLSVSEVFAAREPSAKKKSTLVVYLAGDRVV